MHHLRQSSALQQSDTNSDVELGLLGGEARMSLVKTAFKRRAGYMYSDSYTAHAH